MLKHYFIILILILILASVIHNTPTSFIGGPLSILRIEYSHNIGGVVKKTPIQTTTQKEKNQREEKKIIITASEINLAINNRLEAKEIIVQGMGNSLNRIKLISFDKYTGSKWVLSTEFRPILIEAEYYQHGNITKILINSDVLEHVITQQHTALIMDINTLPRLGEFIILPVSPVLPAHRNKERFILYSVPIYEDKRKVKVQILLDNDLRYIAFKPSKIQRYLTISISQEHIDLQRYIHVFEQLKVSDIAIYKQMNETTNRVRNLAQQLYLSFKERSLQELLSSLTAILQSTIRYSTNLSIPKNVDVVDWLLFEDGKGVCIHYASAAAVLLRAMGIKARVTIGYLANWLTPHAYRSQPLSSSEKLVILSSHAWVEIYIPGYGWIPYDPTPSSQVPINIFPLLSMGSVGISNPPITRRPPGRLLQEELLGYQAGNTTTKETFELLRNSILICIFITLIPLYVFSGMLNGLVSKFRYLVAIIRKDYVKTFRFFLSSLAKKYGIEVKLSKTPREITEEVIKLAPLDLSKELEALTSTYEDLRYSTRKERKDLLREFWIRYKRVKKLVKRYEWY